MDVGHWGRGLRTRLVGRAPWLHGRTRGVRVDLHLERDVRRTPFPGAVTGGLLGWAEYLRRVGPPRRWRLLALAPLTFAVAPMLIPGAVTTLVTTGMGSGAIAVGLMGIVGGYALSGRGRRWPRVVCGAAGVGFTAALAATVAGMTDLALSLTDPRGAWAAVLAASLYPVLALGCSIPYRSAWSRGCRTDPRPRSPRERPHP